MDIDIHALEARTRYKLLTGIVVPRPIAWVSTVDRNGIANLAPFSFFNVVSHSPPTISISIEHVPERYQGKDTLRNILATGEFVVNIADETLAQAMNETATDYPPAVDEFARAGLTALPSIKVSAPRAKEAPVNMECRLYGLLPVGIATSGYTLVVGEVLLLHARDDIIDGRAHVDIQKLRPIGRLAGSDYTVVHETFSITRNRYTSATGKTIPQKE
ncbi:MAG TPA: flavin reductase family protein [Ktedonobacteraceae bacterium]|jgi:flavin reductase (DIM6/NTAB) family NADH-FMN oxidoreductase RutF|nr:flavin reductase family protein [Ktedonobacteraceae bacterium]